MTAQLKRAYDALDDEALMNRMRKGQIIRLVIERPPDNVLREHMPPTARPLKYGEYQIRHLGGGQWAVCAREINADVWYVMEGPWFEAK